MPRLIVISTLAILLAFTGYPKLNSQAKSGGLGNGIYTRTGIYMSDVAVQRPPVQVNDDIASHVY